MDDVEIITEQVTGLDFSASHNYRGGSAGFSKKLNIDLLYKGSKDLPNKCDLVKKIKASHH